MSGDAIPLCPNCRKAGWHYVAPRLGVPGYYACPEPEPVPPDPHQLDALAALRSRLTEGDTERDGWKVEAHRMSLAAVAADRDLATAESRLSTLEGENARLRADAARLDWLEKQVAATPEQGHGGDIMVWGSHRGPTIGHGAWLNPTTTEHNDSGPSLRTAIDAAMSRRADPHGGER